MWLLAGLLFLLGKLAVLAAQPKAHLGDKLAFALLWPGMDFTAFTRTGLPRHSFWLRGTFNLLGGAALTWLLARALPQHFLATWLCMIGFIWAMHGGVFTLLAAFWRMRGRDVMPLMQAPLKAASVTAFWSKHWNHAFRDLSHRLLFLPVSRRWGAKAGLVAVFLISGLIHELVVTVPAGGGYGGPTLYFALQAVAVLLECGCPLKSPIIWRARTLAFVLLPLPLGFPTPFVMNVCHPFFQAIGALP